MSRLETCGTVTPQSADCESSISFRLIWKGEIGRYMDCDGEANIAICAWQPATSLATNLGYSAVAVCRLEKESKGLDTLNQMRSQK